jgi:hypothetical protein
MFHMRVYVYAHTYIRIRVRAHTDKQTQRERENSDGQWCTIASETTIPAVAGARRVDVARRGAALLPSKLAASARLAALLASEVARAQALALVAHLPSRTVGVDGALVGRSEVAARAAPALEAHACAIAIAPEEKHKEFFQCQKNFRI